MKESISITQSLEILINPVDGIGHSCLSSFPPVRASVSANMKSATYMLRCSLCGLEFEDDGFRLTCPQPHAPSLLRTCYSSPTLQWRPGEDGIYRYQCWLPDARRLPSAGRTVTYQSSQLSSILRLPNLWIAFSGYWPERGAALETSTFKELEVGGVLSRMPATDSRTLVVASAGNTAAAFARCCSENDVPCLIVIPESGMSRMSFAHPLKPCVKIVCLTGGATYSDAIALAEQISQLDGFVSEGGVRNVGRRDGMATAMLNAAETIGRLPDYYFQAIGSGAGAIAAHEAAKRLIRDSRFGCNLPHLMLAQNAPFTPIHDSWKRGCRELIEVDPSTARALASKIFAQVLSNQRPPYSLTGGMFDALCESQGEVFAITNEEATEAMRIFESCEGIDIDPAAGVAVAALMKAAHTGQIGQNAIVLLHITGGGAQRRAEKEKLFPASPDLRLSLEEFGDSSALQKVLGAISRHKSSGAGA